MAVESDEERWLVHKHTRGHYVNNHFLLTHRRYRLHSTEVQ